MAYSIINPNNNTTITGVLSDKSFDKNAREVIKVDSNLAQQYDTIISQYDKLIQDASYQGINLLKKGNLNIIFNESRNHKYSISGRDMTSEGIGLVSKNWKYTIDIQNSIKELTNVLNNIRSYQSELGTQYQVIQTRQNFTEALSNVLETGADSLVLADMNEETANYLALQTRQQLATNSLSLAAQSAQSVLSLF
jgi:flagellin-like hook-associated protein FlgL